MFSLLPAAGISSEAAISQTGIVSYMPDVTDSMSWPDYWLQNDAGADQELADWRSITALNSAMLAKEAYNTGKPIRQVILEKGILTKERMNHILSPKAMTTPGIAE